MTCENCDCIHEGDVAEHIMNTNVFGVVIGFMGSLVGIRAAPFLDTLWFHTFELRRRDADRSGPGGQEDLPADNVIPVDFTQPRKRATLH